MFRRATFTLTTCLILYGVSQVYAMMVAPLLASSKNTHDLAAVLPQPGVEQQGPRDLIETARKHLPDDQWALKAKIRVQKQNKYIYCGSWERTDESRSIRFSPFAMVIHPETKPGETQPGETKEDLKNKKPITIVADSAVVQFSRAVKITEIDVDLIERGVLTGSVRIRGDEGTSLDGRNFIFDRKANHIRSDHQVQFSWNGHRGQARSFEMELQTDEEKGIDQFAYSGAKAVFLRNDVRILYQPKDALFPVWIQAAGSLQYHFDSLRAILQESVVIENQTQLGKVDSLRTDLLTLQFQEKPKDDFIQQDENQTDKTHTDEPRSTLQLASLIAEGQRVELNSEEKDFNAKLKRLTYDAKTRTTTLTSDIDVRVRHQMNHLNCPTIILVQGEQNELKEMHCLGKGSLKSFDPETQQGVFDAEWQKHMVLKPDAQADSRLSVLELSNKAILRQPLKKSGLVAEQIRVWLDLSDVRLGNVTTAGFGSSKQKKQTKKEETKKPLPANIVKKLVAEKNVAMISPTFEGEFKKQLEILFHPMSPERIVKRAIRKSQTPPKKQNKKNNSPANATALQSPVVLSANQVQLRVELSEENEQADPQSDEARAEREEPFVVTDVVTTGSVSVEIYRPESMKPLHVTADRMHLENSIDDDQRLSLEGKPARIFDPTQGVQIDGEQMMFDRTRNLARVDSPGLIQMPVANSLDGKPLEKPSQLFISWNEQMIFDGVEARFLGQVKGTLAEGSLNCEEMIATLSRKIDFSDPPRKTKRQRKPTKLKEVVCRNQVLFHMHHYEEKKLVSIRRAGAWELKLDQTTGKTSARGPGWLLFWSRKKEGQASAFEWNKKEKVSKKEKQKDDPNKWQYVRIDFSGSMKGDIDSRISTLYDRVRVLYGPVMKPLDTISRDKIPEEGGWLSCEELEFLQKSSGSEKNKDKQAKTSRGDFNLRAKTNAIIQGQLFRARGDQITYDSVPQLFMLRANGKGYATIWRRKHPGEKADRIDAKTIQFSPLGNRIEFDRSTGIQARSF